MFERFTDRARKVVTLAQEEARALKHNYIGTEHLLLGVVSEGEGVGAQALVGLGLDLDKVRLRTLEIIGDDHLRADVPNVVGHIPWTPRCKKVLELSLREALQLGHNYIGTEHLVLALVREGEGVAGQVLIELVGGLSPVRTKIIELLSGYDKPQRPPVIIEMSDEAAFELIRWLVRIEHLMGPLAAEHPATLLRVALTATKSK